MFIEAILRCGRNRSPGFCYIGSESRPSAGVLTDPYRAAALFTDAPCPLQRLAQCAAPPHPHPHSPGDSCSLLLCLAQEGAVDVS
jgi:hypothetical protein